MNNEIKIGRIINFIRNSIKVFQMIPAALLKVYNINRNWLN